MKKRILKLLLMLLMMGLILPGFVSAEEYEKKADNFIMLLDLSGSMDKEFQGSGKTKLRTAKNELKTLNANIADLDYNAGIYSFTPFNSLLPMGTYSKSSFERAIDSLPEDYPWNGFFSKASPLGNGIQQLDTILADLKGKTVIYLLSDGQNTDRLIPYKEAARLQDKYNVCFTIISMADTEYRKDLLEKIAGESRCSKIYAAGEAQENMKLAAAELYSVVEMAVVQEDVAPEVGAAEAYSPPDTDNDGINDELDKCPNTPSGFDIDASGCLIPKDIATKEFAFPINSGSLSQEGQTALNIIGEYLSNHPELSLSIAGHTCALGTEAYNMALSKRRASSVYNYLVDNYNLDKGQISMAWYGETRPIASNATNAGRLKNRRVDINIVNSKNRQ